MHAKVERKKRRTEEDDVIHRRNFGFSIDDLVQIKKTHYSFAHTDLTLDTIYKCFAHAAPQVRLNECKTFSD